MNLSSVQPKIASAYPNNVASSNPQSLVSSSSHPCAVASSFSSGLTSTSSHPNDIGATFHRRDPASTFSHGNDHQLRSHLDTRPWSYDAKSHLQATFYHSDDAASSYQHGSASSQLECNAAPHLHGTASSHLDGQPYSYGAKSHTNSYHSDDAAITFRRRSASSHLECNAAAHLRRTPSLYLDYANPHVDARWTKWTPPMRRHSEGRRRHSASLERNLPASSSIHWASSALSTARSRAPLTSSWYGAPLASPSCAPLAKPLRRSSSLVDGKMKSENWRLKNHKRFFIFEIIIISFCTHISLQLTIVFFVSIHVLPKKEKKKNENKKRKKKQ